MRRFILLGYILGLHLQGNNQVALLGTSYNVDVYKPYTELAGDYQKEHGTVHSWMGSAHFLKKALSSAKLDWSVGFAYKLIRYRVDNRFFYFVAHDLVYNQFYLKQVAMDLEVMSNNLGVMNELRYRFTSENKPIRYSAGVQLTLYCIENYKSEYMPEEMEGVTPFSKRKGTYFRFPSADAKLFYRAFLDRKEGGCDLGFTLSVGTNVYSNWDQFKRYGWVGVGLDLGINRKPEKKE